ncbi:hypothetical protein [Nitrosophilus alvini]|uniref:hypothetical protein n=1 Tax=Nitrosophilus alvini TaxID=2714855 RepID=UPI00190B9C29|nr:hypothetical protein [Nitrosophilus alvini]
MENSSSLLDRRDFIKIKFFVLMYAYFSSVFGIKIFNNNDKQKIIDYEILDKLLDLPFSEKVKKEIELRVRLQKKYSTDAKGDLIPLNRFFKEIGTYIISNKNINDFHLIHNFKDPHIDRIYYLDKAAQYNNTEVLRYITRNILSLDNKTLDNALQLALKSRSFDTTIELLKHNVKISKQTKKVLFALYKEERKSPYFKRISQKTNIPLLSNEKPCKQSVKPKSRFAKKAIDYSMQFFDIEDSFYEYVLIVVNNSLIDLCNKSYIDDFSYYKSQNKIHITLWSYKRYYPIDFLSIIESTFQANGFGPIEEYLGKYFRLKNLQFKDIDYFDLLKIEIF